MITVTGSLAFDHIMDYPGLFADHIIPDKIHQINLSFLVNTLKRQRGGTAGNIAYNLALLKNPVTILGIAGPDFAEYGQFLQTAGVDISQIKISEDSTSTCYIMTDKADNQITAFYPGAMNQTASLNLSLPTDFVVVSPNAPAAMVKFVRECQDKNIKYMLDPGMQLPSLEAEDLKNMVQNADILISNDYEIELLMSKLKCQMSNLLDNAGIVITTLGEKGSKIQTSEKTCTIPAAKPLSVVDPTGAGDAYRAGFLTGYLKGFYLQTCGQIGSLAACYAVEKYGTTNHKFTLQQFCERYKENFGEELNI